MATQIAVREIPGAEYPGWNQLVARAAGGSPYATPEYLDALCSAAGGRFRILGAYRGDELVGGIGLYERSSRAGAWVWPRLLLYYNGPVLRDFETKYPSQRTSRAVETLGALVDAVSERGYASVVLKGRSSLDDGRPFLAKGWNLRPSYSYLVSITDLAAQWGRVEQNLRRLIERARQQGLAITEDDDFAGFHALHTSTLGRHGVAAYLPRDAFHSWFSRLRAEKLVRLFHARMPEGRIAASLLVLAGQHPVTHSVSAAADPALQSSGANPFLRWGVFEALSKEGYAGNDLTDAALNPVTHFKAQLGGDLVLSLVAESPTTWRWRAGTALEGGYRFTRRLARSAVHRLRGSTGEE